MPITVEGYEVPNRLLLKGSGSIDLAEMLRSIAEHRSGERRQMPFILDFTEATLDLSSDDIANLAERMAEETKRSPTGPMAFVAPADEVYGIGRMYKSYSGIAGRSEVGIFRNMAAAEQWLGTLTTR